MRTVNDPNWSYIWWPVVKLLVYAWLACYLPVEFLRTGPLRAELLLDFALGAAIGGGYTAFRFWLVRRSSVDFLATGTLPLYDWPAGDKRLPPLWVRRLVPGALVILAVAIVVADTPHGACAFGLGAWAGLLPLAVAEGHDWMHIWDPPDGDK